MANVEIREPSKQVIQVRENSTGNNVEATKSISVIQVESNRGPKGFDGEQGIRGIQGIQGIPGPIDTTGRDRANHTGTQSLDTTTDSATRFAMTTSEKTSLANATSSPTAGTLALRDASGKVSFNVVYSTAIQDTTATALTRKDYVDTKANHTQIYTANGPKSGFHLDLSLDYDTTVVTLNEPIMVKAKTDTTALTRAFWLNESGAVRGAAIKLDPAARFYGPPTDSPNTVVLDIHSSDKVAGKGPRWGIDAAGRPRLGPNREVGSHVLVLAAGAAVPTDIPVGTVIMRTS